VEGVRAVAGPRISRLRELIEEALADVEEAWSLVEHGSWEEYHLSRAREALIEALEELGGWDG
jgi:hypothetical protein